VRQGDVLSFGEGALRAIVLRATVRQSGGPLRIQRHFSGVLEKLGRMPLPPYIKEELRDSERYQTVYAREAGSAAAPTAGLHFTKELLGRLEDMGVKLCYLTLHVGLGTFRPVKEENIEDHPMHAEFCTVSEEAARTVNDARRAGGRIVAEGTTSCRTLESFAQEDGTLSFRQRLDGYLLIYPGYRFKCIGRAITNFSSAGEHPIMLVSALAGRERILAAYELAVRRGTASFPSARYVYLLRLLCFS
jgi:S-adenosylmethionine:tRNA ribosyltransferase-isomerase